MREKEPTTTVIYVRHGKTDFPTDRIYCDNTEDPPLNAEGISQAQAAAKLIQVHCSIDLVYMSPSSRTRMTAREIAKDLKAPVFEDQNLCERCFGSWDGLYFKEIAQNHPEEYQLWRKDPVHYTPEGGETINDLLGRVTSAVRGMIDNNQGKTILVVSHVGPIRVCIAHAMKIPITNYRQLRIDYGALTRIDYGATQNNLVYANVSRLLFDL